MINNIPPHKAYTYVSQGFTVRKDILVRYIANHSVEAKNRRIEQKNEMIEFDKLISQPMDKWLKRWGNK